LRGFAGKLSIEATLDAGNTRDNYFELAAAAGTTLPVTDNNFLNLEGNYTWIRVTVTDFTAGTINKVSIGY